MWKGIISKMAVKTQIGKLDEDARELEYIYRDKVIGIIIAKVPKKYKEMTKTALEEHIDRRWTVRNTRELGQISPVTGNQYRLTHPAPILGYATEAEADKRVGEANKAGHISRAKAAAKRRKTVKQELAEVDEDFAEKIAEEVATTTKDTKLKQVLDRMVLTFSERLSDDKRHSQRRSIIDKDIKELKEVIESDESYTQEDIMAFSKLMSKLKGKPFFSKIHEAELRDIAESMRKKYRFDDSKNASWQDSLKKSKIIEAIKRFEEKHLRSE